MALVKPMMVLGGTLHEQSRGSIRAAAQSTMESLTKSKFSSLMESQGQAPTPRTAPLQAAQTRAIAGLARMLDNSGDPLQDAHTAKSVQNMVGALNQEMASRPTLSGNTVRAPIALNRQRDVLPVSSPVANKVRAIKAVQQQLSQASDVGTLGKLAARFESGKDGIAAIGYDRTGGTSYGKYQIASKPGSMDKFLNFLDEHAPDISKTLRDAGPANTGGRKGKMPTAWREVAEKEPERFAALQEHFIHDSHYKPALDSIKEAGFNTDQFSPALKEVLWSTAVQHGPKSAARIFIRAAEQAGSQQQEQALIKGVYANRAGQFSSSTQEVRAAVHQRLKQEQNLALAMTANPSRKT